MRDGGPGQSRQREGQEEDGHVDGGRAEQQLQPHQDGTDHDGDPPEEEDERGRAGRAARGSRRREGRSDRAEEVTGVEPGPLGDGGTEGVGDGQPHLHEGDGHRGQQHSQGHVDQHGA